ncbi:MAG: glycosyltransferase family 2 protein [Prevotella sp.]|nr:glycosyltransferase family 2 protein [Prevotella sp.]
MITTIERTINDNKSGGGKCPLVSIAVPIYNVEPFIERCARSLFEQTYSNLEFIFVDDASPDKSIQILERVILDYPERADRIRILHHDVNRGLPETRNTLVDNATGEFIFHVDSDDWVELNAVELLVNKQLETGADIVTGNAYIHVDDGERILSTSGWDLDKYTMLEKVLKDEVSSMFWLRLISRKLYVEHEIKGDVNVSCFEDYLVFPRLLYYADTVAGIENRIYHYNYMNTQSRTYAARHDFRHYIQSYIAIFSRLSAFFDDKENKWKDALEKHKVMRYHYMMLKAAYYRDHSNYSKCMNLLKQTDSRFWYIVRWNKLFFRKLESNYFMARQTYPIRMFLQKLKYKYRISRA